MKSFKFLLICCLGLSVINSAVAQNAAVVNGKAISSAKLDRLLSTAGAAATNPELRNQARNMLITRELILQEANKRGITQDETIQDQIEQAKLNVLVGALMDNYIQNGGVSDQELQGAYDQIKGQFGGKEYKVRHILVQKETEAKNIIAKIKSGEKFEDLAKANSKDPGSAANGGDLDWMNPQALVPEFSKAMASLKPGQLTDKPVKSQFGYHIIRLDDVRDAKTPTISELKPQLIQMLSQDQNWQKIKFTEMIAKFREKAKIE